MGCFSPLVFRSLPSALSLGFSPFFLASAAFVSGLFVASATTLEEVVGFLSCSGASSFDFFGDFPDFFFGLGLSDATEEPEVEEEEEEEEVAEEEEDREEDDLE